MIILFVSLLGCVLDSIILTIGRYHSLVFGIFARLIVSLYLCFYWRLWFSLHELEYQHSWHYCTYKTPIWKERTVQHLCFLHFIYFSSPEQLWSDRFDRCHTFSIFNGYHRLDKGNNDQQNIHTSISHYLYVTILLTNSSWKYDSW